MNIQWGWVIGFLAQNSSDLQLLLIFMTVIHFLSFLYFLPGDCYLIVIPIFRNPRFFPTSRWNGCSDEEKYKNHWRSRKKRWAASLWHWRNWISWWLNRESRPEIMMTFFVLHPMQPLELSILVVIIFISWLTVIFHNQISKQKLPYLLFF